MAIFSEDQKIKLYSDKGKIKRVYSGNERIYSSGNIVTYHVDAEHIYTEEVDGGASCLSPKTFTPVKNGWTFIGWSLKDGGEILPALSMGENPVSLYASWIANETDVLHNSDYVSYSGDMVGTGAGETPGIHKMAQVNSPYIGNQATKEGTGYLSIKLGPYKKATVVLHPRTENTTVWYESGRHGRVSINGTEIVNSQHQNNGGNEREYTYTYTSNATISLYARAHIDGNNGGAYTWVIARCDVKSIKLSM